MYIKAVFQALAVNVFFKKSFSLLKHWPCVIICAIFGWTSGTINLISIGPLLLADPEEFKAIWNSLDSQDGVNFVLAFFTFLVLGTEPNLYQIWRILPLISLFQIIRKPDSFKNKIRPIRVGFAPISIILTWYVSINQMIESGLFTTTGILSFMALALSFTASMILRPDNYEILRLVTTKPYGLRQLKEPHAYCNMLSTLICLMMVYYLQDER